MIVAVAVVAMVLAILVVEIINCAGVVVPAVASVVNGGGTDG